MTWNRVLNIITSIIIRNGKIVWKCGPYCWYFPLNLKYMGWSYREYIKTARNGGFWEELFSVNNFETVLVNFCCYGNGANASQAVQKFATNQRDYVKFSSCVIVCWIVKIYQWKTVRKDWLLASNLRK